WEVFVGGVFVLIVLFFPEGIVGTLWRFVGSRATPIREPGAIGGEPVSPARAPVTAPVTDGVSAADRVLLESPGLTQEVGGLVAVNAVDFRIRRGELRAVIGPNGAGKTTFFNMLTGVLHPSRGRIVFKGRDITWLPAYAVSRLGIARSYQVTNIFGDLSVFENVRIAAQSRVTHYGCGRDADRLVGVNHRADDILRLLGLEAKRNLPAAALSHGEQRYLEIGIALATDPDFLLLDEPTAGMSPEETGRTATFIRKLAGQLTIVLVEHDMEVVMGISDRITVLNY